MLDPVPPSLIKLSPDLHPDTVVYRTVDFFSAASMHLSGTLMFSRADTFSDKNEGVDRLLVQLEASLPDGGCGGMGWTNAETAQREHEAVKRSYYISCWSRTKESVAMWSLYSPDFCSVRVSTRISNLLKPVNSLIAKYSVARLTVADLGKKVIVASEARIDPVTYVSLTDISRKIALRVKARSRLQERYRRKGLTPPSLNEINPRYWEREQQRRFRELQTAFNIKDESFTHEAEIRVSVRVGETTCSDGEFKIQELLDPANPHHDLLAKDIMAWPWVQSLSTPEREFANCGISLIESVAIDPRCPAHKAAFMKAWFREHQIPVVDSECFGYLPDRFTVYPTR